MAFNQRQLDIETLQNMGLSSCTDPIVCKDGFELHLEAGALYESTPANSIGPWTHLEITSVSESDPELIPYTAFKYAYETGHLRYLQVPVETIKQVIESHGGLHKVKNTPGKPVKLKTHVLLHSVGFGYTYLMDQKYLKTGLKWGE